MLFDLSLVLVVPRSRLSVPWDVAINQEPGKNFVATGNKKGVTTGLISWRLLYEAITRFALGYLSGHRCSIAGNGPDHGCSKYGRRTRRHADGAEFF